MMDRQLLSPLPYPVATFLLDHAQISSPYLSEQLASLDHCSRSIVLDRRKEQIIVICKDRRSIPDLFSKAEQWGWTPCGCMPDPI